MVAFDGAQILDITGPLEILAGVSDELALQGRTGPAYEMQIVASKKGPIKTTSGMRLHADRSFDDVTDAELGALDTLMVCGGDGTYEAIRNERIVEFVRRAGQHARQLVSICSGTFLLAEAGLIDGHRVTSHWSAVELLAKHYPSLEVEKDAIYVRDRNVWSSAGITAGMDLALALVEEDWGREMALAVARRHVVFMMRPGGQSQFSAQLIAQHAEDGRLGELTEWIFENVGSDLSVPVLADRAHMSERTLSRAFVAETGMTPGRFVEIARLEAARERLERSQAAIEEVAADCGFSGSEQMRRTFHRHLGVSPNDYRARFGYRTSA